MTCSIILYHTDTKIPEHFADCVAKIRQLSNIQIYFLTDSDFNTDISNFNILNIKKYDNLNWLQKLDYFKNDNSFGNLWRSSCFRMFYIKELMQELNLTNVLHFDNDVLLFENPEKLIEHMSNVDMEYAITAHNKDEVVMGMSFIKNHDSLLPILNFIQNELQKQFSSLQSSYNGYPNEMQLISKSNLVDFLPILPTSITEERYSKYFEIFNSVFDPSSYGQYLGGTFNDKTPGWFGTHQEIGRLISLNKISVMMEDKFPYMCMEGQKIKINNLHVHSKLTRIFM
jgi:hypothetical protein